jgi:hypothetical protein
MPASHDPSIIIPDGNTGEANTFTLMYFEPHVRRVHGGDALRVEELAVLLYHVLPLAMPIQAKRMAMFLPSPRFDRKHTGGVDMPEAQKLNKAMYDGYPGYKRKN